MLFSVFAFTLSLAGLAAATPLKRAPNLVVSLSTGAPTIESVDGLTLTATVENTGDEDIKVLKFGTVLDSGLPTNSFVVTRDGNPVPFQGVKVQLSMADLTDESFVVIPAGQTVTATHTNIGQLYKFDDFGTGTFSFTPKEDFQVASADGVVSDIADTLRVTSLVPTVSIHVSGDVAKRDLEIVNEVEAGIETRELDKRARVSCSTSSSSSFISSAYSEGKSLASLGVNYVNSRGASDSLVRSYFGNLASRAVQVLTVTANENSSSRTLNCNDPYGICTGGVIAYTVTSTTNIYFCSIFYSEVTTSRLCSGTTVASRTVRGGTVLHEITHAVAGTTDVGYGCSYDMNLASSNPSRAVTNADNYNCFATQVYANTQC